MSEHVILLHGIWMRGVVLQPLARRIQRAGYSIETLDYATVRGGVQQAANRLRERMRASGADAVHLVGHSLGGLVALEAVRDAGVLPPGNVVCLGTPLRGSAVARRALGIPGGRWLLGQSGATLATGVDSWQDGSRRVGVIAGRLPYGLGAALGALEGSHDGTVTVEETRLPGITDHVTVASSHSGLIFSTRVADRTIAFLRQGRFDPARGAAAADG